ncbi:MAG: FAD-binding oxidoreductase [Bacteroidota bacterium]
MNVDYLIVGQGICGTFLSHELVKAGKSVLVMDESKSHSASKVASGVINPITGRRMVRTWEIETLMPYAVEAYEAFGDELNAPLIRQCNILDFHPTPQMVLAFAERQPVEKEYLRNPADTDQWRTYFNFDFTIGEIDPCWLIDLNTLLSTWRKKLQQQNQLLETRFAWSDCLVSEEKVSYQNITAQKIIFCEGVAGFDNPYFKNLPYAPNKGQALIVRIPGLPRTNIFKQGITIVPWQDDLFWVGSSYEWDFTDTSPSPDFRTRTEAQLAHWLKLPFEVIDHIASERPANMERRPFVGLHPLMPSVGVFNGMGTKGCSLAPYFSKEFAGFLANGTPIMAQADVRRFTKILSR